MIHLSDIFFFFFLRCLLGWTSKSLRHLSHCNSLCGGALRLPEPLGLCLLFCQGYFVPSCGSRPRWVLCSVLLLVSLASGWVCFWPAVSGAHVGCDVCAVSAALRGWSSFCCVCLSYACSGGTGCLVAVFWPLLLLLWVELPWGLCCGVLSPWPLVAPSPSVVSSLGFFLWRLFRLGLEGCGPVLDPPFFFLGGGGGLSFLCLRCFRLAVPTVLLSKLLEFS